MHRLKWLEFSSLSFVRFQWKYFLKKFMETELFNSIHFWDERTKNGFFLWPFMASKKGFSSTLKELPQCHRNATLPNNHWLTSGVVLVGKMPSTTWKISSQDGLGSGDRFLPHEVRPFWRGTREQPHLRGPKLTKLINHLHPLGWSSKGLTCRRCRILKVWRFVSSDHCRSHFTYHCRPLIPLMVRKSCEPPGMYQTHRK